MFILAIDPDVTASGVTLLNKTTKTVQTGLFTFPELIDLLYSFKGSNIPVSVHVEAGWLNSSNWHLTNKNNKRTASAIGKQVGRNHEVGRKIVEMAEHLGFKTTIVKPLRKMWGKSGKEKISHKELSEMLSKKRYTGNLKRNQDVRDSCLIAITR